MGDAAHVEGMNTCRFCRHQAPHRSYGCTDAACKCMAPPARAYAGQAPALAVVREMPTSDSHEMIREVA